MTYIVAFNGPPKSGKDTIANAIHESERISIGSERMALAAPMRKVCMELAGIEDTDENYATAKETKLDLFADETLRQAMIDMSEEWVKKFYGKDFWGKKLWQDSKIAGMPGLILISDLGFVEETDFLVSQVGQENFLLVHMHRDGCDFSVDSRGYIPLDKFQGLTVCNTATPDEVAGQIISQMIRMGWTI